MNNLFQRVKEGHDGKGRIVFVCTDAAGFFVYKPQTGFKSKHWPTQDDADMQTCFDRQVCCTQNAGFYEEGEAPAADEDYTLLPATAKAQNAPKVPRVPKIPAAAKPATAKKTAKAVKA